MIKLVGVTMLTRIHNEHKNIVRLLNVLQNKLDAIKAEKSVRYKLIRDIIDYMQEYADKYHHPKEDLIYDYYLKYCDVTESVADRLALDHKKLHAETLDLQYTVDMILMDAVVPLDQFSVKLSTYITNQLEHLQFEEKELLPEISKKLSADDWKQIEQSWLHSDVDDPLFGREVAGRYRDLAKRITESN